MTKEVVETVQAVKEAVPGVEGKLIEMLDALQNGAVKVGEQVVKYSPDVAEAALWVVRIDGAQSIVFGVAGIPAACISVRLAKRYHAYLKSVKLNDEPPIVVVIFLWCLAAWASLASASCLLSVWNWIAVFQPKLWLAKQIIDAVVK